MYVLAIWFTEDTLVPLIIGDYQKNLAFEDAETFRKQCYKVQVCNYTSPEYLKILLTPPEPPIQIPHP